MSEYIVNIAWSYVTRHHKTNKKSQPAILRNQLKCQFRWKK